MGIEKTIAFRTIRGMPHEIAFVLRIGDCDIAKLAFCDSLLHSFVSFVNHSKTPNCYLCVIETIPFIKKLKI